MFHKRLFLGQSFYEYGSKLMQNGESSHELLIMLKFMIKYI
jgi:hypothetical protein